jgi:enamine deaminase RidA (YjgF/YER057c/UK114 family)
MSTPNQHLQPTGLSINPSYSHVAVTDRPKTIYVSGQVSMDADGKLVGEGDLAAQTEQVLRNLGLALAAANATFADVVKITTFVVDYTQEARGLIANVRSKFFPTPPPASTLVGVSALALPGWLIEIEAIATLD